MSPAPTSVSTPPTEGGGGDGEGVGDGDGGEEGSGPVGRIRESPPQADSVTTSETVQTWRSINRQRF
jgi:hypothetical protein